LCTNTREFQRNCYLISTISVSARTKSFEKTRMCGKFLNYNEIQGSLQDNLFQLMLANKEALNQVQCWEMRKFLRKYSAAEKNVFTLLILRNVWERF
jgi:hypothetical protein